MLALTLVLFVISVALVIYHHVGYPLVLRWLTRNDANIEATPAVSTGLRPSLHVVIPAYNEAAHIAAKISNLGMQTLADMRVTVACDGCTDDTAEIARRAAAAPENAHLNITVIDHAENRGKVTLVNEAVEAVQEEVVVLSDASALLSCDALERVADLFAESENIGVVNGCYELLSAADRQRAYWNYQNDLKRREGALGAVIGSHGAFYAFRRAAWAPLPKDTINDDFIQPMRIVARGFQSAYDRNIAAIELEADSCEADVGRRVRISAGNLQQVLRLINLLHPRHGLVAWMFLSGKTLRVMMPFWMGLAWATSGALMVLGGMTLLGALGAAAFLPQTLIYAGAPFMPQDAEQGFGKILSRVRYIVVGHAATAAGVWGYLRGEFNRGWRNGTTEEAAA